MKTSKYNQTYRNRLGQETPCRVYEDAGFEMDYERNMSRRKVKIGFETDTHLYTVWADQVWNNIKTTL